MHHASIRPPRIRPTHIAGLVWPLLALLVTVGVTNRLSVAAEIEFNRDVRPILANHCYACHGPDAAAREADLRLDVESVAKAERDGIRVIAAGDVAASELIRRIDHADPDVRMPPPDHGKPLSAGQRQILRKWIDSGAVYQGHWAFIRPTRPELPAVRDTAWVRNPIDHFVLARLEAAGLSGAPPATRERLLRRASFDVRGLPPTVEELDSFLGDLRPGAYERAVERLFASPAYGEHRARYWMDAARYADTNGFFTDDERSMWPWRDWVIRAFNTNMPFDQFTVEQLAGDLLPNATLEQQLATGFHRNHMITHETGVIDEEYRVEYVVDRLNTTAAVWLGLTAGCARCHDHKFDPLTQREFYQLYAFFNNGPEKGNAGHPGNVAPLLDIPSPELERELEQTSAAAEKAERELAALEPRIGAAVEQWRGELSGRPRETSLPGLVAHFPLDATTTAHTTLHGDAELVDGIVGKAIQFGGDGHIESDAHWDIRRSAPFTVSAWVLPQKSGPICIVSQSDDTDAFRGFDLIIRKGKAMIQLVHRWRGNAIAVVSRSSVPTGRWQHFLVRYDGSSQATGVEFFINGEKQEMTIREDTLTQSIQTQQPLRIGRRSTSAPFVGRLDDVRFYSRRLDDGEVRQLAHGQWLQHLLAAAPDDSTAEAFREHYLRWVAPGDLRRAFARAAAARAALQTAQRKRSNVMVMRELAERRKTYVLARGQYDAPAEEVTPAVPAWLPPLADSTGSSDTPDRLALARWLVAADNPLTARVAVNRLWQQYWGRGIVATTEDFGLQGRYPSDPQLLDWLAVELMESGYDLQHIQRLIVTSATYRQSAMNRTARPWLGRGPRVRLDAETIRDHALATSGLLCRTVGGRSVKPGQPPGLWEAVSYDGDARYEADEGEARYRRGLYTYWKRQSPPPNLLAFDAPTRETCTLTRPRTNTPLQALVLLNDETFVEAARHLAVRLFRDHCGKQAVDHRLSHGFRLATSRRPTEQELDLLRDFYRAERRAFASDPQRARQLIGNSLPAAVTSAGDCQTRPMEAELAAMISVGNLLLNLDEAIHR